MSRACAKYVDDLSGFVDETLPESRWQEVAYHLAGCPACREEVLAIREVRSALSATDPEVRAPSDLTGRLEAIAGEMASQPLYLAPGEADHLPSRRRKRRRRIAQTSVVTLAMVVSVAVVAIILAPEPRVLDDPIGDAREQYAMQDTAVSVQEAVGAVLLAQDRGASFGSSRAVHQGEVPHTDALPISDEAADQVLSADAESQAAVTGVQRVWVVNTGGGYFSSDVLINRVPGEGSNLVVLDRRGNRFISTFLPDLDAGAVSAPEGWDFFTYPTLGEVAGRSAMIVEARVGDAPVSRWWFDAETGLLLRTERYDSDGKPTIMVAYTQFSPGRASLPSSRSQLITLSSASTSGERGWCVGFETCPYSIGGLSLVAYTSSSARGERGMSLVYSNGVQTLTASWEEGVLAGDETTVSAEAATGLPSVKAWQAGNGVVAVATNGSPALMAAAEEELPRPAAYEHGMWERLVSGMGRLAGIG